MSHSLNEIGAMCKRAARGAGLSWGQAEDAAKGARWLSAFGLPGPRLLAARLSLLEGDDAAGLAPVSLIGIWHGAHGRLCPLVAGAALSDRAAELAAERCIDMHHVVCPLMICPFAADAALSLATPVRVEWDDVRLTTDGHRLGIEGARERLGEERCERLRCRVAQAMPARATSPEGRGRVDADTWERLTALAGRTYAPATEESRRRGAGGADDH